MRSRWLLLMPLLAAACSDDATTPSGSAPHIGNLQFSPEFVYVTDFSAGGCPVTGSFDFEDADGDLAILRMTSSGGLDQSTPIEGAAGLTRGTLVGTLVVPESPPGEYGIQVWVEDEAGQRSNTLTGTFGVRIDDSATGWTTRPSGTTVQFNRVAAGTGGWFAVGYGGVILRSGDGLAWSPCNSGTSSVLWGAAWSGALHVAVGEDGAICTSPDGITWAASAYPAPTTDLYAVAWSGAVFAAVGSIGGLEPTQVLTSPDGAVWSPRPPIPGLHELRAIAWSGTRFVAMGTGNGDSTLVASSPDGDDWTVDARLAPMFPRDLCWSGSRFVAAGATGSMSVSADGKQWEIHATGSPGLFGVAWSGNRFVAVGVGIHQSTDGTQWSQVSQEQLLRSVLWTGERYLAVGGAGAIQSSP